MAFEAKYQNLFSQQIITGSSSQFITTNSESVKFDQANSVYECNNFVQSGHANPCATRSMGLSPLNHEYLDYHNVMTRAQTSIKNSLGLACNLPGQGKRSRDLLAHQFNVPPNNISFPSPTEMQQYLESNCAKKMKVKIAERGKEATRLLIDKVTKPMIKDLKEQEEKIMNLEKLNLALEEKVKTLMVEKQLWKDIANCMNEITGMCCNLDNVMANVSNHPVVAGGLPVVVAQDGAGLGMMTGANYDYGISGMVDVGGELVGQGPILVSKAAEVVGSSGGRRGPGRGKLRMCKCNKGNHMT